MTHPSGHFSGHNISALKECCALKFLHALETDQGYLAHIDLPELHVHRKMTEVHTPCTWFWDTVYVVIRQLLLLRFEFRIPKLTFHSDLLHSSLEKNPAFHAKTLRSGHRALHTNSKKCAERRGARPSNWRRRLCL